MPSVITSNPRVKSVRPPRQRKPLMPVNVTGVFEPGVMPHHLLHGCAILTITDANKPEAERESFYWATAILAGGHLVALDLQKFGRKLGEDHHRVSLDPLSCDCEDATYRPDRSGGCRHVNAVRQALVELAGRQGLKGVGTRGGKWRAGAARTRPTPHRLSRQRPGL
jgi:hypothetical protein